MRTIKGTITAWLPDYYGPQDLCGTNKKAMAALHFTDANMTPSGWALVGTATLSLNVPSDDVLINNKIEALKVEKQTIRAEAEMKSRAIDEKIQKLLAIEFVWSAS